MSKIVAAEKKAMAGESIPYVRCERFRTSMTLKRCKERQEEYKKTSCAKCIGGVRTGIPSKVDLSAVQDKLAGKRSSPRPMPNRAVMEVKMEEAIKEEKNFKHVPKGRNCPVCPGKNRPVFYLVEYEDFDGLHGRGLCKACYQRYRTLQKNRKKGNRSPIPKDVIITCGDCLEKWMYMGGADESCPHCTVEKVEEVPEVDPTRAGDVRVTVRDLDGKVVDERVVEGVTLKMGVDPGAPEGDETVTGKFPCDEDVIRTIRETPAKNLADVLWKIFKVVEKDGLNVNITIGGKER